MREDKTIPRRVSYTDEDVANAAKRDKLRKGTYRAVLEDVVRDVSKETKHLMLVFTWGVLSDPEDAGSVVMRVKMWQCLPFRNVQVADHVPKKFFGQSTAWTLAAILGELSEAQAKARGEVVNEDGSKEVVKLQRVPNPPNKNEDGDLMYDGEPLDGDEYMEKRKEALGKAFEVADALYNDRTDNLLNALKNTACYFDIDYEEGSDFPNVRKLRSELLPGEELVPAELMLEDDDAANDDIEAPEEEEEEEVEAVDEHIKRTSKAPEVKASKKTAKKKGRN